jgi:hypothetical protein
MKKPYIFLVDLADELGIDRSSLLRKAKRETTVIQRTRRTNGGYKLLSTVSHTYANQLRKTRQEADKVS